MVGRPRKKQGRDWRNVAPGGPGRPGGPGPEPCPGPCADMVAEESSLRSCAPMGSVRCRHQDQQPETRRKVDQDSGSGDAGISEKMGKKKMEASREDHNEQDLMKEKAEHVNL